MSTVYYLQWHNWKPKLDDQATDLFHRYHQHPPPTFTEETFNDLYKQVAKVETNDLEQLFAEWNAGSGRESDQFRSLRYCERCQSFIEGRGEAEIHAAENHGYDAVRESGDPGYLRGVRSMSVGDIVTHGNTHYACVPIGWREIRIIEGDPG